MTNAERTQVLNKILIILEPWITEPEALDEVSERTGLITDMGLDSIGVIWKERERFRGDVLQPYSHDGFHPHIRPFH